MCQLFDCYVAAARRVHVRRGLRPDGIMRETTLQALMCRPTCELSQLKTTRRASRHRPATLATVFVVAKIPAAQIEAIENDSVSVLCRCCGWALIWDRPVRGH